MRYPEYWIKIREKHPRFCAVKCNYCQMFVKSEKVWKVKTNDLTNLKANTGSDPHHRDPVYYSTEKKVINWVIREDSEKYYLK